jgi:hypothetical protein
MLYSISNLKALVFLLVKLFLHFDCYRSKIIQCPHQSETLALRTNFVTLVLASKIWSWPTGSLMALTLRVQALMVLALPLGFWP